MENSADNICAEMMNILYFCFKNRYILHTVYTAAYIACTYLLYSGQNLENVLNQLLICI